MKSLRIIVLLFSSLSLYGMDNGELRPPIGSPARTAPQDASPFESPETAELRCLANPNGTPRRNALAQALARLAFKPEGKSPRSEQRAAAGTCMDKNLDFMQRARDVVAGFSPRQKRAQSKRPFSDDSDNDYSDGDGSDGDHENQSLQKKRRYLVFMGLSGTNWRAKLAAAQQQQQQQQQQQPQAAQQQEQQQINIDALETLAQSGPPMEINSPVVSIRRQGAAAAQERLGARKRAFHDKESDSDDEDAPRQPAQKKQKTSF
jgi:hypothetical protein